MKCPKCRKPSKLQTKRTLANGREVRRDRYCRKCKNRFITIERFDTDIADADSRYERRIGELESNNRSLKYQLEVYRDVLRSFKIALDKAGEKDEKH